jgi:hypothetical protein
MSHLFSPTRLILPVLTLVGLFIGAPAISAGAADEKPAADDKSAPLSLMNGGMQFTPPPAPWFLTSATNDGRSAVYTTPTSAIMLVRALGGQSPKDPARAEQLRDLLLQDLKTQYRQKVSRPNDPVELVQDVTEDKDERIFLLVSAKYKKAGQTYVTWHLYRDLKPHQVMVQVISPIDDDEQARKARDAAINVAMGASLIPKGEKAPQSALEKMDGAPARGGGAAQADPVEKQPAAPAGGDLQAAQQALADAEAQALAKLETKPDYAKAKKLAQDTEAQLKALKAAEPPDRAKIAEASITWIKAKSAFEAAKEEGLARDPAVAAARKKLAEAKEHNK